MSFRFFRPWEDGEHGNTRQTPDPRSEASSEPSKTTTPPYVLSVQAEQHGVSSEEATRSVQVLSDIAGPLYQEVEAHRTERKDVANASQWAAVSSQNSLASQDRVLRQTSASGSRGNADSIGRDSDSANKEEEAYARHNLNHIQKSSRETHKHNLGANKPPSSIMSSHLTSSGTLQNDPSLQVTSADNSLVHGNTLCNRDSLACSSTFVAKDDDFHTKINLDLSAFTKDASEMNHSRVIRHSSMLEKRQQLSPSTPPKDECSVEALSDASSAGRQEHHQNESKLFQCKTCGKSFSLSSNMHRHEKIHLKLRPFQCAVCDKTFSRLDSFRRHKRTHTGCKPYQCPVCEKAFSDLSNFHVHERTHKGSRSFKCFVCEKAFKQSGTLRVHERIHTESKPFKCSVCEKAFKQSGTLHVHERIHTESKPFKCSVCEKAFKQSGNLHRHERIHTGSMPFICSVCEKAFKQSSHLHRHERIHNGSKPFKCSVCAKSFRQSSTLHVHERIHTGSKPFKCSVCKKAFKQSGDLHKHERIHTRSKPFKCTVCEKAFADKSSMNVHERIHTSSKSFKCSFCGKAFKHSKSLHSHKRLHTL